MYTNINIVLLYKYNRNFVIVSYSYTSMYTKYNYIYTSTILKIYDTETVRNISVNCLI